MPFTLKNHPLYILNYFQFVDMGMFLCSCVSGYSWQLSQNSWHGKVPVFLNVPVFLCTPGNCQKIVDMGKFLGSLMFLCSCVSGLLLATVTKFLTAMYLFYWMWKFIPPTFAPNFPFHFGRGKYIYKPPHFQPDWLGLRFFPSLFHPLHLPLSSC